MCRNIKPLFNFDPPVTDEEIERASLQFVRKVSGYNKPSAANEEAFNSAVKNISRDTQKLFEVLVTNAQPRDRDEEVERARIRSERRFGKKD